jgi:hypothetical protein
MSVNLPDAITGTYPNQTVDYNLVTMGKGSLLRPRNLGVQSVNDGEITVSWDSNGNDTTGFDNDKSVITIYNPTKDESVQDIFNSQRSSGSRVVSVPTEWQNDTIHVYLSFVSADNSKASDSVHSMHEINWQ